MSGLKRRVLKPVIFYLMHSITILLARQYLHLHSNPPSCTATFVPVQLCSQLLPFLLVSWSCT